MTFTASDVSSLAKSLSRWEIAEYIFAGLVTVACAGEYVADFKDRFTGGDKAKKERLAKASTLLLIGALALELTCLVKTNSLSGQLIGSLDEKAGEADTKANTALGTSATALTQSGVAKASAEGAAEAAARANESAKQANGLAINARSVAEDAIVRAEDAGRKISDLNVKAEALRKSLRDVDIKASARTFDRDAFLKALKDKPTGRVEVWYLWPDVQVRGLADTIAGAFFQSRWDVVVPGWRIPDSGASTESSPWEQSAPLWVSTDEMRLDATKYGDIVLFAPVVRQNSETSLSGTLYWEVYSALSSGVVGGAGVTTVRTSNVPENCFCFVIVVGPKHNPPASQQ